MFVCRLCVVFKSSFCVVLCCVVLFCFVLFRMCVCFAVCCAVLCCCVLPQVAQAVAALQQHPAPKPVRPDALDPAFLRYGCRVVLQSCVGGVGRLTARPDEDSVHVEGVGAGHENEVFVLQNSLYTADRGNLLFSDAVSVLEWFFVVAAKALLSPDSSCVCLPHPRCACGPLPPGTTCTLRPPRGARACAMRTTRRPPTSGL